MIEVELPETLVLEVDALVTTGVFATRDEAFAELVRLGMGVFRSRSRPPMPPRPPIPPGHREPADDEPIHVDPSDVKWMDR